MDVVGSILLASSSLLAMAPARVRWETWQGGSGLLRNYKEDSGFLPAQHALPLPLYEALPVP